jgi:thiosulfate/3-mercaptopyruvate sulfurtransferase
VEFTTLIDTASLARFLHDKAVAIADCRFDMTDTSAGERAYVASHVPGAVYVHLDRDLSAPKTGANGRHPLPAPSTLAETFGRLGIDGRTQVVAYDQDSGSIASRLWWMLRWLGHDRVAVLDGGFAKWVAEQRRVIGGVEKREPRTFRAAPRPDMIATIEDVAAKPSRGWHLVDARAPERYRGDSEPLDKVAGHIPGASNHHFQSNLTAAGTFRSTPDLAARLEKLLGTTAADRVICYCGSGVTACHNLLALEHAGMRGAKLYPGGWSEWSADSSRGIERSPERSKESE